MVLIFRIREWYVRSYIQILVGPNKKNLLVRGKMWMNGHPVSCFFGSFKSLAPWFTYTYCILVRSRVVVRICLDLSNLSHHGSHIHTPYNIYKVPGIENSTYSGVFILLVLRLPISHNTGGLISADENVIPFGI